MIKFNQEPVIDNVLGQAEALTLGYRHHAENERYPYALDIDFAAYERFAKAGRLRYYTIRNNDVLIGYGTYFIDRVIRFNALCATQDMLYLVPEFRNGMVGVNFMRYMEAELKKEGIALIQSCVCPQGTLGQLLPRLGYEQTDVVFTKRLGD